MTSELFSANLGRAKVTDVNKEKRELSPIKICTHQGLVDFFSLYADLQTDPMDFKPSKKAWAKKQADKAWLQMAPGGAVQTDSSKNFYLGIYDGDHIVATGQLDIKTSPQRKKPYGYLCHAVVDENHRNNGLAKQLTAAREEMAKEAGCDLVYALVNTGNMGAILTKMHDGFVVSGFQRYSPDWTEFVITKSLTKERGQNRKRHETIDVSLTDLYKLQELLEDGYVGIEVKTNAGGGKTKEWIMVLQK